MGKPKMYGMNKTFIPNSKADQRRNKKFFDHGKDSTESEERIDRLHKKKFRKEHKK